jgi:DNA-binding NarL/FixJ family response regulator
MTRLGSGDLASILEAVREVGNARDPDAFTRSVVQQVARLVPSDFVAVNEVDPDLGRVVYMTEPSSFTVAPEFEALLIELADQHPLIHHYLATGDGSAQRISDFWTREEFHDSPIYQQIYRHLGVEYQMAMNLPAPRPLVVAIVVSRSDSDFSERDRMVLNVLRPHFVQALYNAKDQQRLRSYFSAASDASMDGGAQLILLSDPPQDLTPEAMVSLYRSFGRPSKSSAFPPRVERWLASQRSRLDLGPPAELNKPLRARADEDHAVLRFIPPQDDHPGALVLRFEPQTPRQRSLTSLGLTTREAEIVQCLIGGDTNAAIADRLHVSPGTIKRHLDNIYAKLGVRGRGRVTAFVLDVLER